MPSDGIALRNVNLAYRRRGREPLEALRDINLEVRDRELFAIVGPTGCGKSSLLLLVSGILQPTGGEVTIRGGSVGEARARTEFGFIFQDAVLLPWRTALDARQPTTHEAIHKSVLGTVVFQCGPDALKFRYITEDVPYALVLIADVGDAAGIDTPVIDGLIALACAMNATDYRAAGRSLASLGLGGLDRAALLRAVDEGT